MFSLGFQEILIIILVIILLIDHQKLPEFLRGVGRFYRDIKHTQENIKNEIMREGMLDDISNSANSSPDRPLKNTIYEVDNERENDSGKAG